MQPTCRPHAMSSMWTTDAHWSQQCQTSGATMQPTRPCLHSNDSYMAWQARAIRHRPLALVIRSTTTCTKPSGNNRWANLNCTIFSTPTVALYNWTSLSSGYSKVALSRVYVRSSGDTCWTYIRTIFQANSAWSFWNLSQASTPSRRVFDFDGLFIRCSSTQASLSGSIWSGPYQH